MVNNEKWTIKKIGLLNYWWYDEEELEFLFFNTVVMEKYKEKKLNVDENECIILNKNQFVNIIEEVKEKYQEGFSKEYREKSIPLMGEEVCKYMKEFSMLEIDDEEYKLMPIIFKLKGKYM